MFNLEPSDQKLRTTEPSGCLNDRSNRGALADSARDIMRKEQDRGYCLTAFVRSTTINSGHV